MNLITLIPLFVTQLYTLQLITLQCKQVTQKRRRLPNKGSIVNTNVIEISSSDDEKARQTSLNEKQPKKINHNDTVV